jgi:hypothetical protein
MSSPRPEGKPLHVGLEEHRHKVGHCYEDSRWSGRDRGVCGDPRCREAKGSGVTMMRDERTSRAWLHFPGRPSAEVVAALKAEGWRWSGYRKAWHHPGRYTQPPACVAYLDAGACNYSDERAERLEDRADTAGEKAQAASSRASAVASLIPFGQPVLVGHHSERRHRRDLARIESGHREAFEEGAKAKRLADAAESSRRHQAHQDSALGLTRRLERLRAELRRMERNAPLHGAAERFCAIVEDLKQRIAQDEAALAALPPLPCAQLTVQVGDLVDVRGHVVRVSRVNAKTYSGTIERGGAAGMSGKWAHADLRSIIEGAAPAAAQP